MPSAKAAWSGRATASYRWWMLALGGLVAVMGAAIAVALANNEVAAAWGSALLCVAVGAFVSWSAINFGSVVLVLDGAGVHVSFGPWSWPRRDLPWAGVTAARVVDVRAWPWGGWGMRWRPGDGTAALVRQGPGVEFTLTSGKVLVVTLDDADAAAAASRTWLASHHD